MPRIDAPIATQVADIARPRQAHRELRQQAEIARVAQDDGSALDLVAAAPPGADDLQASAERLKQVVEAASGRKLRFDIDDESRSFLVKVKDEQTGEVIKQIPSEAILDLRQRLDALVGMLVDERA